MLISILLITKKQLKPCPPSNLLIQCLTRLLSKHPFFFLSRCLKGSLNRSRLCMTSFHFLHCLSLLASIYCFLFLLFIFLFQFIYPFAKFKSKIKIKFSCPVPAKISFAPDNGILYPDVTRSHTSMTASTWNNKRTETGRNETRFRNQK